MNYYYKYISNILECIKQLNISKFILSIDGLGGSGKSTLAKELSKYLSNCFIVHMDDFYKPKELRNESNKKTEIGGYFDWKRLERELLIHFVENQDIKYQKYNWKTGKLDDWEYISKSSSIIVEGVYSSRKELSKYYNMTIWIECSPEVRLSRGIERDGKEMKEYWLNVWMKQENEYYKNKNPKLFSDIIINTSNA
jgi:uridine kinase